MSPAPFRHHRHSRLAFTRSKSSLVLMSAQVHCRELSVLFCSSPSRQSRIKEDSNRHYPGWHFWLYLMLLNFAQRDP